MLTISVVMKTTSVVRMSPSSGPSMTSRPKRLRCTRHRLQKRNPTVMMMAMLTTFAKLPLV